MSDAATTNLTDKATYERLQKDVIAVKNDIAALTEQITDALNSFVGSASRQARRGYRQGVNWLTRSFPGQKHNEISWASRVDVPLRFLLSPVAERRH